MRLAALVASLAAYTGDFGVLDPALQTPLVPPDPEGLPRYVRESKRLSFYDFFRLHMSTITRWSRMYRTTGNQRGELVLMVLRLAPKKRNDSRWVYVRPDRSLAVVDVKDRARISTRRQANWVYDAFPALTAEEKADVLERAKA